VLPSFRIRRRGLYVSNDRITFQAVGPKRGLTKCGSFRAASYADGCQNARTRPQHVCILTKCMTAGEGNNVGPLEVAPGVCNPEAVKVRWTASSVTEPSR